jgi:hypothetical protein
MVIFAFREDTDSPKRFAQLDWDFQLQVKFVRLVSRDKIREYGLHIVKNAFKAGRGTYLQYFELGH